MASNHGREVLPRGLPDPHYRILRSGARPDPFDDLQREKDKLLGRRTAKHDRDTASQLGPSWDALFSDDEGDESDEDDDKKDEIPYDLYIPDRFGDFRSLARSRKDMGVAAQENFYPSLWNADPKKPNPAATPKNDPALGRKQYLEILHREMPSDGVFDHSYKTPGGSWCGGVTIHGYVSAEKKVVTPAEFLGIQNLDIEIFDLSLTRTPPRFNFDPNAPAQRRLDVYRLALFAVLRDGLEAFLKWALPTYDTIVSTIPRLVVWHRCLEVLKDLVEQNPEKVLDEAYYRAIKGQASFLFSRALLAAVDINRHRSGLAQFTNAMHRYRESLELLLTARLNTTVQFTPEQHQLLNSIIDRNSSAWRAGCKLLETGFAEWIDLEAAAATVRAMVMQVDRLRVEL